MERTNTPGIYKRGSRYVVVYKVDGRQRKESARTYAEARRLKSSREADRDRGDLHQQSRVKFREYAEEWVERHQGRGGRGFRDATRDEYRRALEQYAYPFLDGRLHRRLGEITPRDMANFLKWVSEQPGKKKGSTLSDESVRRILAPVRSCLATAVSEHLLRHNPCEGVQLPYTEPVEATGADEKVKAFTRAQLAAFLNMVHTDWRLFFRLLAATGMRWSEIIGLQWRHLKLDGDAPHVEVRRRYRLGRYGPPKSKYGIRDIPLPDDLVRALRMAGRGRDPLALVFQTELGNPLDHSNMMRDVLRPVVEEVGAPWAGFHTFRHTCASLLFAEGRNPKQVQRWLGHHSAAFTLDVYGHLLDEGVGEPLTLPSGVPQGGNQVATEATETHRTSGEPVAA
jgi:integrase